MIFNHILFFYFLLSLYCSISNNKGIHQYNEIYFLYIQEKLQLQIQYRAYTIHYTAQDKTYINEHAGQKTE